jgi:YidC/Oxa1 family membrane protein insertase
MKFLFIRLCNLFSFFYLEQGYKKFVFYSEGINYRNYFFDIIKILAKDNNIKVTYVSSDINDKINIENVKNIYIGNGYLRTIFFSSLNCKNLILTLTDLDNSYLKKSKLCNNYIYIFHSAISTHVGYTKKAFWNYDYILCNGDYQYKELSETEKLYNLKRKKLIKSGYSYFDYLKKNYKKKDTKKIKNILIAPTWVEDKKNLFEDYAQNIIRNLLNSEYVVTLRPHPEHFKRSKKVLNKIQIEFSKNNNFKFEQNINSLDSLNSSDLLITDYSGISVEYLLAFKKPIIFINSSPKINNQEYQKLNIESIEQKVKKNFGYQLLGNEISKIDKIIKKINEDELLNFNSIDSFLKDNFYNTEKTNINIVRFLKTLI